jgi:signal transduction histidine kinase
LSNAVKFSRPDGVVTVSVLNLGNDVQISVQDEGIGIPDSFRDQVFEKFTQVDSSDTRRYGGTGLGMFIAKTIVEDHGGNINYESSGGVGTTFHVKLPVFHQFHS